MYDEVIRLIRESAQQPIKRADPFLTFLLVAMIRDTFYLVKVDRW